MRLKTINIRNFRLLKNVELNIDDKTTLIIGRNNSAKTSSMHFISKVLKNKNLSYDDYPLCLRRKVFRLLLRLHKGSITFDDFLIKFPQASLTFFVDYSKEENEDNLGALSPFIIDVDYNLTSAIIKAEYILRPDEMYVKSFLEKYITFNDNGKINVNIADLKDEIIEIFPNIFQLVVTAINPNNSANTQIKEHKELVALFPLYTIWAERYLDETTDGQQGTLKDVINGFFNKAINPNEGEVSATIQLLQEKVEEANKNIQRETTDILSQLIHNTIGFGYPNAEELQLAVQTKLKINEQIQNNSELIYSNQYNGENLPSSYNGLCSCPICESILKFSVYTVAQCFLFCKTSFDGPPRVRSNIVVL